MKKAILIIFAVGVVFLGCESPYTPEVEEIVKPTAQIVFSISPNPIVFRMYLSLIGEPLFLTAQFKITLTEHNGVKALLHSVIADVYYDGGREIWEFDGKNRVIPANGKLDSFYTLEPLLFWVTPYEVEITVVIFDVNDHEIVMVKKIAVTRA